MNDLNSYYGLFGCYPEDSDYVFNEKCNQVFDKYQGDKAMCAKLQEVYIYLKKNRDDYLKPGDIKGEERNLKNIEHELLACQKKLASGFGKKDCLEEINNIKLSIIRITPFWVYVTKKRLENTGFENYCVDQYEEYIKNFFEEQMQKRILGSREDKFLGWIKNYTPEKGDFLHYARNSMSHIRNDLKKYLCDIKTCELDASKIGSGTGVYSGISDEEAEKMKLEEKKRQEVNKKYNTDQLLWILSKGPHILKIREAVNSSCQENDFARYYISNVALTLLKEVILVLAPENVTAAMVDRLLMMKVSEGCVSANTDDIYESLALGFVDYIMTDKCMDIDDIIQYDLHKYQDLGIEKKGDIRFFKGGIKYIDEILVQYYATVKGEKDKKSQSMKTIRTRHWKKFEELVLLGQQG